MAAEPLWQEDEEDEEGFESSAERLKGNEAHLVSPPHRTTTIGMASDALDEKK